LRISETKDGLFIILKLKNSDWANGRAETFLGDLKKAIPTRERDCNYNEREWVITNNAKHKAILKTLEEFHFA
jgi:hypothetical protein